MGAGGTGINNTGLGTAQATVLINTNGIKNATLMFNAMGKAGKNAAAEIAAELNKKMQIQNAETAVMRTQLQIVNQKIAAEKQAITVAQQASKAALDSAEKQLAAIRKVIAQQRYQNEKMGVPLNQGTAPNVVQAGLLAAKINQQKVANMAANNAAQQSLSLLNLESQALAKNVAQRQNQTAKLKETITAKQQEANAYRQTTREYFEAIAAMAALSAAGAKVFNIGTTGAGFLEQQQIAFNALTGSQENGIALMKQLQKASADLKIPFNDIVVATRTILPTLEGSTEQLSKQLDIIRRVNTMNPKQGIASAAFSVNEALVAGGTDLRSISQRFNISKGIFRDEFAKSNNDFWVALDKTLDRMGATQTAAEEMGDAWTNSVNMAKDALTQLLAEGFLPIIKTMTPYLHMFTGWVQSLKQSQKETLGIAAGFSSILAIGTPVLFFLGKWMGMLRDIGKEAWKVATAIAASQGGKTALKLGIYGAAAYGGLMVGNEINNQIRGVKGQDPKSLSDVLQPVKDLLFTAVTYIVKGFFAAGLAVMYFQRALMQANVAIRTWVRDLTATFGGQTEYMQKGLDKAQKALDIYNKAMDSENVDRAINIVMSPLKSLMYGGGASSGGASNNNRYSRPGKLEGYNTEQSDIIYDYFRSVEKMERDYAKDSLSAERSFGQQRAQTIRDHNQDLLREQEDYLRNRFRLEHEYQKSVQSVVSDYNKQVAEWNADFAEKEAELRSDSNDKIKEINEDYEKDRLKRERQHKENLMQAAAMLDAKAVWEEQKSFARANKEAMEDRDEQLEDEKDKLQERIDEDKKAHEEQLQEAKEAHIERLNDMAKEHEDRKALEDEDRRIRLERQQADFSQQLADQQAAFAQQQADRALQHAEEKKALEENMREQLLAQGVFGTTWLKNQTLWQEQSLKKFQQWFTDMARTFEGPLTKEEAEKRAKEKAEADKVPGFFTGFASGGYVSKSGLALLHQGERVQSASKTMSGGWGNRGNVFEKGAIVVNAAPGMDEKRLAQLVVDKMELAFERMS